MKNFDTYVKSGAMHRTVGEATRKAGVMAREHGLPAAGPAKVPANIAAVLAKPPVRKSPVLSREFLVSQVKIPSVNTQD